MTRYAAHLKQFLIPFKCADVHEHIAGGVGHIGDNSAGKLPDKIGVHCTENDFPFPKMFCNGRDILNQPDHLACREIWRKAETGFPCKRFLIHFHLQSRNYAAGPEILPDNGVMVDFPAFRVECNGGLPLIRYSDGLNFPFFHSGFHEGAADHFPGVFPYLRAVMFNPARFGIYLSVFNLIACDYLSG